MAGLSGQEVRAPSAEAEDHVEKYGSDPRFVAPFLPMLQEQVWTSVAQLLHQAPSVRNSGLPFLELGSGDGRVSIHVASQCGVNTVGLELDEELLEVARRSAAKQGLGARCEFRSEDVMAKQWNVPGRWAAIFVFLLPEALAELEKDLLALGCPILCGAFALPNVKASASGTGWYLYSPEGVGGADGGEDRAENLFGDRW